MDIRKLVLCAGAAALCGCGQDPGVNAPPDPVVTQAKIDQMSPQQQAAYQQATRSRDQAMAATQGRGPLANKSNGP